MAYDYSIDHERQIVYVRMSGPLTIGEIRQIAAELANDSAVAEGFGELIDLRNAVTDAISGDDVRHLAAAPLDSSSRRAFVASDTLTYGLARMFEIYRQLNRKRDQVAVFRSVADAEEWLASPQPVETPFQDDGRRNGQ